VTRKPAAEQQAVAGVVVLVVLVLVLVLVLVVASTGQRAEKADELQLLNLSPQP